MFIPLDKEVMRDLNGRHLIYLASVKANLPEPVWDDNGSDTIDDHKVMIDYVNGGVLIFD